MTFSVRQVCVVVGVVVMTLLEVPLAAAGLRRSIFKIEATSQWPKFRQPWQYRPPQTGWGTGFYIGKGRIMTNAHVVANARYLTVRRDGEGSTWPAYVEFIGHDCDLAILRLSDPRVLEDVTPLRFGGLPRLRTPVSTIGYPKGGDQISYTDGVVSRIGYRHYVHSGSHSHLLVQVDSAINPGNSGGPVVQGGKVIGVAFQAFTSAENTGYIIPTPIVERFLRDIEDGRYDGHPDIGLVVENHSMSNAATAAFHGLTSKDEGVKVIDVHTSSPTAGKVLPQDILLSVGGQKVGRDGRVVFQGERVHFDIMFDLRLPGEEVEFTVMRNRERKTVSVKVDTSTSGYVGGNVYARRPKYFVYAGLVFTALSRSYLETWGDRWYETAPLLLRYAHFRNAFDPKLRHVEDIIVLSKKLNHPVNRFVTVGRRRKIVEKIGETQVTSMEQFAKLIQDHTSEFLTISYRDDHDETVLLTKEASEADREIRERYGVVPPYWFAGPEVDGALGGGT